MIHSIPLTVFFRPVPIRVAHIFGVSCFALLTALGALVRIPLPFTPVPITLQPFFVLLAGALLGKSRGVASQGFYIVLGIFGVPLFALWGSGISYLFGPTTGYLVGFIVAAYIVGNVAQRRPDNVVAVGGAMVVGSLAILLCGTLWLKALLGVTILQAFAMGTLPFLAGDIIKSIAACTLYGAISRQRHHE